MSSWVRNTVMLMTMVMWFIYISVTLARGGDIDAIVWGLPGAVYFALNPTWGKKDKDDR